MAIVAAGMVHTRLEVVRWQKGGRDCGFEDVQVQPGWLEGGPACTVAWEGVGAGWRGVQACTVAWEEVGRDNGQTELKGLAEEGERKAVCWVRAWGRRALKHPWI